LQTGNRLSQPTALILDDDEATSVAIGAILEDEGFAVIRAITVAEARRVIEQGRVTIVLVDLVLADERGRHLLDDLAGIERAPPMLVVSAAEDAPRVASELSIACVRKPFGVEELVAAINVTQTFCMRPEKRTRSGPRRVVDVNDASASLPSRLVPRRRP
jgi:DNA-binding response OmpR family regulator